MDLDSRGVPGGFVASSEFVDAAQAQASSLGFDPFKVFVEHPIQDRSDQEIVHLADRYFSEVIAMISTSKF
tara:strand:- start:489 stop:701 length:213 start_codon:yes stop_codon:yes gene_type:complete